MPNVTFEPRTTALLLCDMQNDFLHPQGAYARGGVTSTAVTALPARLAEVAAALRSSGGCVVSTHFTLVPERNGEPMISKHLRRLRPFLRAGDFASGSFGHDLVAELKPVEFSLEKVGYSAFYMTRLEWLLRRAVIETLLIAGIATNGGVASTLRDAQARDVGTILLSDGCATFEPRLHDAALASLATMTPTMTCEEFIATVS